jgi:Tfp pilus assembly protein PilZ
MDKRKSRRYKRRIQLRFWSLEERNPRKGFTLNVSTSGMFIASTAPFKAGTRIFVEIPSGSEKLVLQAVVRYAARVDPVLQKVKPSGMGIRLLTVEELMSEILKIRRSSEESTEGPGLDLAIPESAELEGVVLTFTFETPHELANTFQRDLKHGGLFVPTAEAVEEDDQVVVEFLFDWDPGSAVQTQASVIKKFAAAEGSATGETVSGVGVAFSDPGSVKTQFSRIMSGLDQTGSAS